MMKKNPDFEPEPLSDEDFQLALAIRRIVKKHGSIGNFFEHREAERKRSSRAKLEEQNKALHEASYG